MGQIFKVDRQLNPNDIKAFALVEFKILDGANKDVLRKDGGIAAGYDGIAHRYRCVGGNFIEQHVLVRAGIPFEGAKVVGLSQLCRYFQLGVEQGYYGGVPLDRKSTRLNSSHVRISYAVFCLKKKRTEQA